MGLGRAGRRALWLLLHALWHITVGLGHEKREGVPRAFCCGLNPLVCDKNAGQIGARNSGGQSGGCSGAVKPADQRAGMPIAT